MKLPHPSLIVNGGMIERDSLLLPLECNIEVMVGEELSLCIKVRMCRTASWHNFCDVETTLHFDASVTSKKEVDTKQKQHQNL